MKKILIFLAVAMCALDVLGCTSAIVSGRLTKSGRPMIWKHRDTGTEHNFVERVNSTGDGTFGYVALYNGGDRKLEEAWMGMNDAGFAIMNTASYNLMPDTAKLKDREGVVMAAALSQCRTLADFEKMLASMPKPLGVQANFGVMDAEGKCAYYETDDYSFKRYLLDNEPEGVIFRTNYSYSGDTDGGYGYIRECNARHALTPYIKESVVEPEHFTEGVSRSFYHALIGRDFEEGPDRWVVDQDFVPRKSSSASIVIEGLLPGEKPEDMTMWTVIGYPPVSHVKAVTLNNVPEELRPTADKFRSPYCNETLERKHNVFSISRGSGSHYLDMDCVRAYEPEQRELSRRAYEKRRNERDKK